MSIALSSPLPRTQRFKILRRALGGASCVG